MVTYLTLQYDKFIVDRLVGISSLGLYERAYTYAQMPTGAITHVITSVTSSVYARYQKDRESLSRAFTKVFGIIFRVSAPVALVLFVEAEALTRLLLGEAWLGLIPVLRWLIAYAFLKPLLDDTHSLLLAIGQPRKITAFSSVQAAVFLVLTPVLTHRLGMKGTAVSVDIMTAIGFWLAIRYAVRYVDVPWFRIVVPSAAATLAAALASAYVPVAGYFASPWAGLGAEIVLLLSVYVGALLAIEGRRILGEARQVYLIFTDRATLDG
jgi:PST family polysaccharide transporter